MEHSFASDKSYKEFLESKIKNVVDSGFNSESLNPSLFDFQEFIVRKALRKGRFAILADCGLGKTLMQLEWAKQVSEYTNKPVLILAPLAVSGQTIIEGKKFGIEVLKFDDAVSNNIDYAIFISNYEQLENIKCEEFSGIVLDESSILKNFEGATRNLIINKFKDTPYKLACTATPSPNDPMELGNHAEFLNVMSRNEMLAMYFVHDGGDTAKWRLKGHSVKNFYRWVSSWACMLSKPSDLGFSDKGYDLPPLNIIEKEIKTDKRENGQLFNDKAISATNFNEELRLTKVERLDEVANIVNNSSDNFIIWIKQNEEGELLRKLIPDAVEVKGSDSPEYKESKLLGFAKNKFRVLITKAKIASFGLNYQNCQNQIFASLDFSFESLYQAIRRSYRFGQTKQVNIYLITTDTMANVITSIKNKQNQFEEMQRQMTENINELVFDKKSKLKTDKRREISEDFEIVNFDCVQGIYEDLEDESIHFSIFSPPFAELYTYSDHVEDMSNSKDYKEFFMQFEFLVKQLYRVMIPGRIVGVHCMFLPILKSKEGYLGFRNFPYMIQESFERNGFVLHGPPTTIWKDPVVEMQRTKAIGLLNKQKDKDATISRTGNPDFMYWFRKLGENPIPVIHNSTDVNHPNYLSIDMWQKYASPVWMDINQSDTLQFKNAREENDEKHICPLQLEPIRRGIHLYTNPGETVLSPFTGIGSEGDISIRMGRKFRGYEIKESYFNVAVKNLKNAQLSNSQLIVNF